MSKSISSLNLNESFKNKGAITKRKEFGAIFQNNFNANRALYHSIENLKKKAAFIRWKALENLETLLTDFESKARNNGITVHWAPDAQTATDIIVSISAQNRVKRITQTGYTVLNELNLFEPLHAAEIDLVTVDTSNYLNSLNHTPPGHPFFGSFNLNEKEISKKLKEKVVGGLETTEAEQHENIKSIIEAKFKIADAQLCSANFLCADTGDICMVDTEGGTLFGLGKTKTNIIVAGIDSVIPSVNDIELFTHLLALYGISKPNAIYTKLLRRNRQSKNKNTHIILLDNGRTNKLNDPAFRSLLQCINCGACYQACPLVKTSGSGDDTFKNGPIGLAAGDVKHSSLLCEKCTNSCPVHIPLHNIILQRKKQEKESMSATKKKGLYYFFWKQTMMNRDIMNLGGIKTRRQINKKLFNSWWGSTSTIPEIKTESFNEAWRNKYGDD